jgi:hypothetical protein
MAELLACCALPNQVVPTSLDPRTVINSIPLGMHVPNLKGAIMNILKDQELRVSVAVRCVVLLLLWLLLPPLMLLTTCGMTTEPSCERVIDSVCDVGYDLSASMCSCRS